MAKRKRMKPVRAWAIIEDHHIQVNELQFPRVYHVYPTRMDALMDGFPKDIVRVEIREVEVSK